MAIKYLLLVSIPLLLAGCASLQAIGVKISSPVIKQAADQTNESDWDYFKDSTPGNLKFVEGMLAAAPNDGNLLVTLTKGHAGYAYGVLETLYLNDKLTNISPSPLLQQTLRSYSRAIHYGLRYLNYRGVQFDQLRRAERSPGGVSGLLQRHLNDKINDIEAVFFTAQAMAGTINLQRQNIFLVGSLSTVKGMFDWACGERPKLNFNACDIFYASYHAGRPRMLGGNPEKGREIFQKLIKERPQNLLARVSFIENYIIPMGNKKLYKEQLDFLIDAQEKSKMLPEWQITRLSKEERDRKKIKLYNAIALKRFAIIRKYEKDLF